MVVVERNTGDRENRQQRGRIRKEWEEYIEGIERERGIEG